MLPPNSCGILGVDRLLCGFILIFSNLFKESFLLTSLPRIFRRNLWVFSPSELLTSILFLIFFFLAMGACFAERPGSDLAFGLSSLFSLIWLGWMAFVAVRRPPPFCWLGLLRGFGPCLW